MEINIISMTINELDNKQTIKEIYSNINNYKRAIIVYEERIKEQENLLTNIIINKLNKTISIPTIGEIVYFRERWFSEDAKYLRSMKRKAPGYFYD